MSTETPYRRQRICPNCGKEIPNLPKMPRDLGLLINCLIYRVPVEQEMNAAWIEVARRHCKMKPERLAELQAGDHARHWPRLLARRAARLAYFKQHGIAPPSWMGLFPGEPDHDAAINGSRRYRKGGLAKIKARLRKNPNTAWQKLTNRYTSTKRIHSKPRKSAALDDTMARFMANLGASTGRLKLKEFEALKSVMLPDDALPRRWRSKRKKTGSAEGSSGQIAHGEALPFVPQQPGPGGSGVPATPSAPSELERPVPPNP